MPDDCTYSIILACDSYKSLYINATLTSILYGVFTPCNYRTVVFITILHKLWECTVVINLYIVLIFLTRC